jgi:hypothetical protein
MQQHEKFVDDEKKPAIDVDFVKDWQLVLF